MERVGLAVATAIWCQRLAIGNLPVSSAFHHHHFVSSKRFFPTNK